MTRINWFVVFLLQVSAPLTFAGPVVLETDSLRLTIGEDGMVRSLASKPMGKEYVGTNEMIPVAMVYRGGRSVPASQGKYAASTGRWVYRGGQAFAASRVSREGEKLRLEFGEANVSATYRVIAQCQYLAFELLHMTGEPIDRIDLMCLNLTGLPQRGAWVNAAFDDRFGICLCAGNVQTHAEMDQADDHLTMRVTAEQDVGFEGATAVLFGCHDPLASFLDVMAVVERDFEMPPGADNRRRLGQRLSYLWASYPTPENIAEYVRWAERGGFRMILFSYTAFSTGAGHFEWNKSYSHGISDLRKVTNTIRNAGLRVGLHIHYSKTRKNDSYVTPVPDDRLHQVRHFALSQDIGAQTDTIPIDVNPAGCTLDEGRRILKLGSELIAYQSYRTDPPYAFTGCQRGHLGTSASAHQQNARLGLLDVDTWPIFIRYNQDTDIQDEAARRIGKIVRQSGPYEMVYFDGAEDVHEPFWYHVASAQLRLFRHLDPMPAVCEAAHYTHFSWHMITRSNAYDIVASADGMKDFCRLMPCPTAMERTKDFSRIDFGWLGRFGKSPAGCAGPDVWEYVASRAAAWDCPISLKVALPEIASNPRREDCFAAIRTWENARLGNHLTDAQRELLRNVLPEQAQYVPCFEQRGIWENVVANRDLTEVQQQILRNRQEHHLFLNEHGKYELVAISEIPMPGTAAKAYRFQRDAHPQDTYVLLWAIDDPVELQLPVSPNSLRRIRPVGTRQLVAGSKSEAVVTISDRSYLVFVGHDAKRTEQILADASIKD